MTGEAHNTPQEEAQAMLEAFAGVGAKTFDLTRTDAQGKKTGFQKAVPLVELLRTLAAKLAYAERHQQNLILRPHGPDMAFVQLDDIDQAGTDRIRPGTFLLLQTSPGNYQAWVALAEAGEDFARRLRKGVGADPSASGATRIAGSLNFKDKYAPDFPRVAVAHVAPGLIVTREQLQALGLVAAPDIVARTPFRVTRASDRRWPSYDRCLQGAPLNHDQSGPDTSKADFTWCMTAIDWGWSVADTAARLMEYSAKARENGERYAQLTAHNAGEAVMRNRSR